MHRLIARSGSRRHASTTAAPIKNTTATQSFRGLPKDKGLYRSALEKDSCGVGMMAHLKAKPSHNIVKSANTMLARMSHRGGCGCEKNTGDGAGILLATPDGFMRNTAAASLPELAARGGLPEFGQYGVGNVFFSHDAEAQNMCRKIFDKHAKTLGLEILGWRAMPTDNLELGKSALASEPHIEQVFVGNTRSLSPDDFDRELLRLRKLACNEIEGTGLPDFYVCSLSGRTITYKGQLTPEQLPGYYSDLTDTTFESHLALVHSRFSTNTFPSWDRAQPNRMLCHNGEINTLRGNKNWMDARTGAMVSPTMNQGGETSELLPVCSDEMTDSGNFDSVLELLVRGSKRSVPEAMMMLIPEAWQNNPKLSESKRAFYEYNSCLMEPWDGPAMMAFTDGRYLGACLDRNGLRPSRYYVTHDDHVILSSEVGVLPELDAADVKIRSRLEPGRMFLIDFEKGALVNDNDVKEQVANARPYGQWLKEKLARVEDIPAAKITNNAPVLSTGAGVLDDREVTLRRQLNAFGYTTETMDILLTPMVVTKKEGLGSMGVDAPLAVLSRLPKLPSEYFKQLFAQVTNPPIDPIREEIVMSLECPIGPEANLLDVSAEHANRLVLKHPVITDQHMANIKALDTAAVGYKEGRWFSHSVDASYDPSTGPEGLQAALDRISEESATAIRENGAPLIILSHRGVGAGRAPIPSLLATGAVHHHLIKESLRTQAGLLVECGDAREVHDFCTLLGFGADGVNPYVAYDAIKYLNELGRLKTDAGVMLTEEEAVENYRYAAGKGVLKVMSKMGISTLQSYKGAQIFEAVGLADEVVDKCFVGTTTRISGSGFDALHQDVVSMHEMGYPEDPHAHVPLVRNPGDYHYRHGGEKHYNTPESMAELQVAVRNNDVAAWRRYKEYSENANQDMSIRGLLGFVVDDKKSIPVDQVEPASAIMKRFCTGAMSLGSISAEAHETLAIAMNRLGARSNTGEGGEDPRRFMDLPDGDSKRSAIKQVASGRFGVTSNYLANSDQIQIKMAQGAKPGEGGELPGHKVSEEIANVRGTTKGVGLISPPPHHDIYSIEDLAQLIHDLKNAQPNGQVSVKLVSEVGVGIVAAGVAKAFADHITISGGDGGTGAAAWTGIHRAGLPWELGLAETQQTLVLNGLRSRIRLQTDGQIKNGRDVVIAALLGAEEYAFSTAPLVALGCIMMRKCHLNTCPVGIATQDPELRAKFAGEPEHVVNYFTMLSEEVRDYMAIMGFHTMDEMIGRVDKLEMRKERLHYKSKGLDLSPILTPSSSLNPEAGVRHLMGQDHQLELALDNSFIAKSANALKTKKPVYLEYPVNNLNRTVGTMLSYHVSKQYGEAGLPDGTIHIKLNGSAGQSLGFTLAKGITLEVEGDGNDYVGKGLSGGRIVVYPQKVLTDKQGFVAEENVIIGNVALYGATSGDAYFRGLAGERFCVRNSGVDTVVEGVGDHGCEYMTGGHVVVLGATGRNFAAGMSGGVAYVLDPTKDFEDRCNMEMVGLEDVAVGSVDDIRLRRMIETHLRLTGSPVARDMLMNWEQSLSTFTRVMPHDYKKALADQEIEKAAKEAVAMQLGNTAESARTSGAAVAM